MESDDADKEMQGIAKDDFAFRLWVLRNMWRQGERITAIETKVGLVMALISPASLIGLMIAVIALITLYLK